MKLRILTFLALIAIFTAPVFAQQPTGQPGQDPNSGAGNSGFLQMEVLDNFEESEDWKAKSTCPIGETKTLKMVQRGEIVQIDDENARPPQEESYSVENNPERPNHILGVKTYFNERGFDRVEVSPPHEYVIKGKARQFSIWVLGRKFRHSAFLKVRDYRGKTHNLPLGRLDYFGWRKLTVTVPGWLPQSTRYSLMDKNLHFVSLFVTSDVHEVPGEYYFYVDGLKVMVDKSEQNYPGSEIKDNW